MIVDTFSGVRRGDSVAYKRAARRPRGALTVAARQARGNVRLPRRASLVFGNADEDLSYGFSLKKIGKKLKKAVKKVSIKNVAKGVRAAAPLVAVGLLPGAGVAALVGKKLLAKVPTRAASIVQQGRAFAPTVKAFAPYVAPKLAPFIAPATMRVAPVNQEPIPSDEQQNVTMIPTAAPGQAPMTTAARASWKNPLLIGGGLLALGTLVYLGTRGRRA